MADHSPSVLFVADDQAQLPLPSSLVVPSLLALWWLYFFDMRRRRG